MYFLILFLLFPVPLMFLFSFLLWFLCNLLLSFLISSSVFSLFSCSISSVSQLLCCFLFRFLSPFPFSSPCQVFRLLTHFCSFSGLSFLIPYHCPIPFCVSIPISSSASSPVSSLVSFAIPSPVSSSVSSLLSSRFLCCFLIPFIFPFPSDLFPASFPSFVFWSLSCLLYCFMQSLLYS